jgi:aryl-alcohol dehydrogenase-like predicted oxidoreductase
MRRGMTWPEGDWRNLYFTRDKLNATLDRVDRLVADLPPGANLPQTALQFILANPDVSTVIPGMRSVRHVESNLAVSGQPPLTSEALARLRNHRWTRTYVVP